MLLGHLLALKVCSAHKNNRVENNNFYSCCFGAIEFHATARTRACATTIKYRNKSKNKALECTKWKLSAGRKALVCWRVHLCCTYCCKQCMPQTSYATATLSLSRTHTHTHKHTNCMRRITVSMPHCIAIFVATSNNRYMCNATCYQLLIHAIYVWRHWQCPRQQH